MKKVLKLYDEVVTKAAKVLFVSEPLNDLKLERRRKSICEANEGICYNALRDRCMECTCYMEAKCGMLKNVNIKAGGRVEITHCPLSKWGGELELPIVNHYRALDNKNLLTL